MKHEGYLSFVQYRPSVSNLEAVNIGVLLYEVRTQAIRLRLLRDNRRINQFFGKQNWSYIERIKMALQERLNLLSFPTSTELSDFIAKRANAVQLSELQAISISDIDSDADRYLQELVTGNKPERRGRIDRAFGEELLGAGIRDLVKGTVSVKLPFFDEPLRAPYGYQNGRFNLISPVQFDADPNTILAKAGQRALEGKLLYKNPDLNKGPLRLVVVAKFADEMDVKLRDLIKGMLEEHDVSMYSFGDLKPLFDDIRAAWQAHCSD